MAELRFDPLWYVRVTIQHREPLTDYWIVEDRLGSVFMWTGTFYNVCQQESEDELGPDDVIEVPAGDLHPLGLANPA